MKAIIPAAGRATRFLPATKSQPKGMLPILAKPTIQYVVEEALAAAASEVIIVTNGDEQGMKAHFTPNPALVEHLEAVGKTGYAEDVRHAGSLPVTFMTQSQPLGLGHAVHCAAAQVPHPSEDEPFYVLLGDVLVPDNTLLPRMLACSQKHDNASVIAVIRVLREEVTRFGIIAGEEVLSGEWQVTNMVEKPTVEEAPSEMAIFGRYLLSPRAMDLLGETSPGAGGEIQLTDALINLLEHEDVYAIEVSAGEGFDVGTVETWLEANVRLASRQGINIG